MRKKLSPAVIVVCLLAITASILCVMFAMQASAMRRVYGSEIRRDIFEINTLTETLLKNLPEEKPLLSHRYAEPFCALNCADDFPSFGDKNRGKSCMKKHLPLPQRQVRRRYGIKNFRKRDISLFGSFFAKLKYAGFILREGRRRPAPFLQWSRVRRGRG